MPWRRLPRARPSPRQRRSRPRARGPLARLEGALITRCRVAGPGRHVVVHVGPSTVTIAGHDGTRMRIPASPLPVSAPSITDTILPQLARRPQAVRQASAHSSSPAGPRAHRFSRGVACTWTRPTVPREAGRLPPNPRRARDARRTSTSCRRSTTALATGVPLTMAQLC